MDKKIEPRVKSRQTTIIRFCLAVAIAFSLLFPPRKIEGDWRNSKTGILAVGHTKIQLNRWYFGYFPEYRFGYAVEKKVIRDGFKKYLSNKNDAYVIESMYSTIDKTALQITLCFLILLFLISNPRRIERRD